MMKENFQDKISHPTILFDNIAKHIKITEKTKNALAEILQEEPTLASLLLYKPSSYRKISRTSNIRSVPIGSVIRIKVTIATHSPSGQYNRKFGKKRVYQIFAVTEEGIPITLLFFKILPFQIQYFAPNTTHTIEGKLEESMGQYRITHPKTVKNQPDSMEVVTKISTKSDDGITFQKEQREEESINSIEPVYRINRSIKQDVMRNLIQEVLKLCQKELSQNIYLCPEKSLSEWSDSNIFDILQKIHNPKTQEELEQTKKATYQLSVLEVLSTRLALKIARQGTLEEKPPIRPSQNNIYEEVKKRLLFNLTNDQEQSIQEIIKDQASSKKMFRLLQGDVGSGKTAVALMAITNVLDAKSRAILMAPTTILANQHYRFITNIMFGMNINIALLTSKTTAKERRKISLALQENKLDIIIGTHSLIQKDNDVKNFQLCIIDEQHRFGVEQRSILLAQNPDADTLMMTATPIPRTVMMMLYDDIKTSYLKSKPKERIEIQTSLISSAKYPELTERLNSELKKGSKIYWICPAVEDSSEKESGEAAGTNNEEIQLISVAERHEKLKNTLGEESLILLHGKMKEKEKNDTMIKFHSSKSKILVSTTVVEVGMDVPDATIIIIEQAERFGLSQLHQLRGRVGRGTEKSHCILLYSEKASSQSKSKLSILKNTTDGFEIAEEDLRQRGSGEIIGTRQSGFGNFKIAAENIGSELLEEVRQMNQFIRANINNPNIATNVSTILALFGYKGDILKLINA